MFHFHLLHGKFSCTRCILHSISNDCMSWSPGYDKYLYFNQKLKFECCMNLQANRLQRISCKRLHLSNSNPAKGVRLSADRQLQNKKPIVRSDILNPENPSPETLNAEHESNPKPEPQIPCSMGCAQWLRCLRKTPFYIGQELFSRLDAWIADCLSTSRVTLQNSEY